MQPDLFIPVLPLEANWIRDPRTLGGLADGLFRFVPGLVIRTSADITIGIRQLLGHAQVVALVDI